MVALYQSMKLSDEPRLEWASALAADPALIAEAFAQTVQALAPYSNPERFYGRQRRSHQVATELVATKDVALRLGPSGTRHHIEGAEQVGLPAGALDFVYLDRELVATRTTSAHRLPEVHLPDQELRLDLLLCAADGVPIVGEIKVKRDRDLTYALIQALACVSLLATPEQSARIHAHYSRHASELAVHDPPLFDVYLVFAPRTGGDTYLSDLDRLAGELAAGLLAQAAVASQVRRIAAIRTGLATDALLLDAAWCKEPPPSARPADTAIAVDIDLVKGLRRMCRARNTVNPEGVDGWSMSTVDPNRLRECFPPLKLRAGYKLHAYQYRAGLNGNGVVWAVPEGARRLSPRELQAAGHLVSPPHPPEALDDFMAAIDGDGSAWSYLCASLLARELTEVGALWHGCSWTDESVIAAAPWASDGHSNGATEIPDTAETAWRSVAALPETWYPTVYREGTVVTVRFLTYSPVGTEAVYDNEDRYTGPGYTLSTRRAVIAEGPGGMVY